MTFQPTKITMFNAIEKKITMFNLTGDNSTPFFLTTVKDSWKKLKRKHNSSLQKERKKKAESGELTVFALPCKCHNESMAAYESYPCDFN